MKNKQPNFSTIKKPNGIKMRKYAKVDDNGDDDSDKDWQTTNNDINIIPIIYAVPYCDDKNASSFS